MKKIKFSGRELATLRAIDFGLGAPGQEIIEKTRIAEEELVETLNGLIDAGFVEANPANQPVRQDTLTTMHFEINPGYVQEIKLSTRRT